MLIKKLTENRKTYCQILVENMSTVLTGEASKDYNKKNKRDINIKNYG